MADNCPQDTDMASAERALGAVDPRTPGILDIPVTERTGIDDRNMTRTFTPLVGVTGSVHEIVEAGHIPGGSPSRPGSSWMYAEVMAAHRGLAYRDAGVGNISQINLLKPGPVVVSERKDRRLREARTGPD